MRNVTAITWLGIGGTFLRLMSFSALAFIALSVMVEPAFAVRLRLTNHGDADCVVAGPSPDADASLTAFASNCDLTGGNSDHNREIFQVDRTGAVTQLTDTSGCANANPSSSALGNVVAYDSDCDLGANGDGNVEIFVAQSGAVSQLSDSANCSSLAPSVSAVGALVSFDSDCDFTGANIDGSVEIFRSTTTGAVTQLTDDRTVSGCASINAASDASGQFIAFESDCDLFGGNPEQTSEIFQSRGGDGFLQITFSFGEPCINATPAVTQDGSSIAYSSDCDALGLNGDGSGEVFTTAIDGEFAQVTSDAGATGCESLDPSIAIQDGGRRIAFASYCNLAGANADGSFEIFRDADGVTSQITDGSDDCWSASPAISTDGSAVVFVSTCDLDTKGTVGAQELFLDACACGAPVSGGEPTATDALFALQGAVGAVECALCDCDTNDDTRVAASDALRILNAAIGLPLELTCP